MSEFSHVGNDVLYIRASIVESILFPTKNSKVDFNVTTLEAFRTGQFIEIDNRNIARFSDFLLKEILKQQMIVFPINYPAVFLIIKFHTLNLKSAVIMTHSWRFYHLKSLFLQVCLNISLKSGNFKTISLLYVFVDNFSSKTLKINETNLVTNFFLKLLTKITDRDFLKTSFETYFFLLHTKKILIFKMPQNTLDLNQLIQLNNVVTFLSYCIIFNIIIC